MSNIFEKLSKVIDGDTSVISNIPARNLRRWLDDRFGKLKPGELVAERVRTVKVQSDYDKAYAEAKGKAQARERRGVAKIRSSDGTSATFPSWNRQDEKGFVDQDMKAFEKKYKNTTVKEFGCKTDLEGISISISDEVKLRLPMLDAALFLAYLHYGEPEELTKLRKAWWESVVEHRRHVKDIRLVIDKDISVDPDDLEALDLIRILSESRDKAEAAYRKAAKTLGGMYGVKPSRLPVWGKRAREEVLAMKVEGRERNLKREAEIVAEAKRNPFKADSAISVEEAEITGYHTLINEAREGGLTLGVGLGNSGPTSTPGPLRRGAYGVECRDAYLLRRAAWRRVCSSTRTV